MAVLFRMNSIVFALASRVKCVALMHKLEDTMMMAPFRLNSGLSSLVQAAR